MQNAHVSPDSDIPDSHRFCGKLKVTKQHGNTTVFILKVTLKSRLSMPQEFIQRHF